jgi:hypothetical protein
MENRCFFKCSSRFHLHQLYSSLVHGISKKKLKDKKKSFIKCGYIGNLVKIFFI